MTKLNKQATVNNAWRRRLHTSLSKASRRRSEELEACLPFRTSGIAVAVDVAGTAVAGTAAAVVAAGNLVGTASAVAAAAAPSWAAGTAAGGQNFAAMAAAAMAAAAFAAPPRLERSDKPVAAFRIPAALANCSASVAQTVLGTGQNHRW